MVVSTDEGAHCVYASGAAASRRSAVVFCHQSQLLCYAAGPRILVYCPQSSRVVGMSLDRSEGLIVGLRAVVGPPSVPPTLLSLHASGAVAVWQMASQPNAQTHHVVSHALHRTVHMPSHHKGSISSGDACFVGHPSRPRLLVVTGGTDHLLKVVILCPASGSVFWDETIELRNRTLVPEIRVVPLAAPSDARSTPLPLILCGGDDSKVRVWAADTTATTRYRLVGTLAGHTDWVTALDFVYVGKTLMVASGSKDGGVRVWRFHLSPEFLVSSAGDINLCIAASDSMEPQAAHVMKQSDDTSASTTSINGEKSVHSNTEGQVNDNAEETPHCNNERPISCNTEESLICNTGGLIKCNIEESINYNTEGSLVCNTERDSTELRVRPISLEVAGSAVLETVLICHEGAVAHLCWLQRRGLKEQNLRLLSCSQTEDRSIVLWQPQNYAHLGTQSVSNDATDEKDSEVWVEGARLGEVGGNREGFFSAVFNRDGTAVYAHSYKGGLHEWRSTDAGEWLPRPTVSGHFRSVVDLSWEPSGRYLLTCSLDQTTRLHAATAEGTWHELCRPQVHGYDMSCVACTSSLNFVAGAEEKVLRAFTGPTQLLKRLATLCNWDMSPQLENRTFVEAASVPSLGLSNKSLVEQNLPPQQQEPSSARPTEDTLMAGTLWPEVAKLYGHGHELMAVAASARHIASACKAATPLDAAIIVWSASTYQQLQQLHHHRLTVTQLCFSSDGEKLLAVSRDRSWSLYQCQQSADEFSLLSHSGLLDKAAQHSRIIWAAAWAPHDSAFVTASRDKTIAVWAPEGQTGQEATPNEQQVWSRKSTLKEENEVTAVAVTAAGDSCWLIATGLVNGDLQVHRYSPADCSVKGTFPLQPSHHSTVRRLAFRPQHEAVLLASCGDDNLVCMYNCTAFV